MVTIAAPGVTGIYRARVRAAGPLTHDHPKGPSSGSATIGRTAALALRMRTMLLLSLMMPIVAGCSQTIHHHTLLSAPAGSEATVILTSYNLTDSPRELQAHAGSPETPSAPTPWLDHTGHVIDPASIATVQTVTVSHLRGAGPGAGLGALFGVSVGVILGLASGNDNPQNFFAFTAKEKATAAGVVLGGVGTLAGLLIGAAIGARTYDEYPNLIVTPTPGGATASAALTF